MIQESYELAFTRLREAYVELSDINSNIIGMTADALRSVYLLITFFARARFRKDNSTQEISRIIFSD